MVDNESERLPQELTAGARSLREQVAEMDFLFEKRLYWEITPDKFPDLPKNIVGIARFAATSGLISGMQAIKEATEDEGLKAKIDGLTTQLIKERDANLASMLDDLPVDQVLIGNQYTFKQDNESTRALEIAIGSGLVGQINSRNFPALRALSAKELAYLRLQALDNQLSKLNDLKSKHKEAGFMNKPNADNIKSKLADEIKEVEANYFELLTEFLTAEKNN